MREQGEISINKIIDHKRPLPYYFQLKELFVNEIKNGRLKPGQQIPSELKPCKRYKVSRTVIRQAISVWCRMGIKMREGQRDLCDQAKDYRKLLPKPYRFLRI